MMLDLMKPRAMCAHPAGAVQDQALVLPVLLPAAGRGAVQR